MAACRRRGAARQGLKVLGHFPGLTGRNEDAACGRPASQSSLSTPMTSAPEGWRWWCCSKLLEQVLRTLSQEEDRLIPASACWPANPVGAVCCRVLLPGPWHLPRWFASGGTREDGCPLATAVVGGAAAGLAERPCWVARDRFSDGEGRLGVASKESASRAIFADLRANFLHPEHTCVADAPRRYAPPFGGRGGLAHRAVGHPARFTDRALPHRAAAPTHRLSDLSGVRFRAFAIPSPERGGIGSATRIARGHAGGETRTEKDSDSNRAVHRLTHTYPRE